MKPQSRSLFSPRDLCTALTLVGALVMAPGAARAHIKMSAPADWIMTNSQGDPQKITPCGVDPALPPPVPPMATGVITPLHVGDMVTFNWTETVPHDGHFRISLAINSRSELTDPVVTKMNSDGTAAAVAISTAYPVLADNLFPHAEVSTPTNKPYTYTVKIPNTPCTKCTLQLLQFMANHPLDPSYFYHQCADVTILAASGGGTSGSTGGSSGSGGAAGKAGGTGGATTGTGGSRNGSGGSTSGTGGVTSGSGGATSGTGGVIADAGGATSGGTGGAASGTGGQVATGTGGGAVGSGGAGATGTGGPGEGGSPDGGGSSGGCACQLGAANANLTGLELLGVALLSLRRRRRSR